MSPIAAVDSSFRDPAGYIFREGATYNRAVTFEGAADYDLLISSGLYRTLSERSLLIRHREKDRPQDGLYRVLEPEQITHISYFYEWSFSELKDAALLTLEIQRQALRHGMSLKDASAFNVQFRGPQPVFIDTLSFEARRPGPWVAYGQFCSHFLAPLALIARVSLQFSSLLRTFLDGVPLDLACSLLPRSSVFSLGLLLHLHLHARAQKKHANTAEGRRTTFQAKDNIKDRTAYIIDSLEDAVRGLRLPKVKTEWAQYYDQATHYSSRAATVKKDFVNRIIQQSCPALVYDLGGNTGTYSRIVTARGAHCISYDLDPLCVDTNYLRSRAERDHHMLPLILDLTNPTPALGFGLHERLSMVERSRPDLVMALALLHHLRITGNIPFANVATFLATLSPEVLIEFVPREDPMAQAIIGNRPDIFRDYSWEQFCAAFDRRFTFECCTEIPDTTRRLCYLKRRA